MSKPTPVNFRNLRLLFTEDGLVRVRPTPLAYFITIGAILFSCVWVGFIFNAIRLMTKSPAWGALIAIPILLLLDWHALRAIGILTPALKIILDLRTRTIFPKGRSKSELQSERYNISGGIPFTDITCIRVTEEEIHWKKSSFLAHRLELIPYHGEPLVLIINSDGEGIHEEARRLSAATGIFLQVSEEAAPPAPTASAPQKSASRNSRISRIPHILFGSVFMLAGIVITWFLFLRPISLWFDSRNWVQTPAVILSSDLKRSVSKGNATYRINITYRYDYDGARYTGTLYDVFRSSISTNIGVSAMRQAVDSHQPGQEVTCLVNPKKPAQALISRDLPTGLIFFTGLFPLVFLGAGITIVVTGIHSGKKSKS